MGPGWLNPRELDDGNCPPGLLQNDRWRENEHSLTVRTAFELCANGSGVGGIIKEMQRRKLVSPTKGKRAGGGGWAPSSVRRLLTDRAVIGEFKSDKVGLLEGYFPETVDADLWMRAQAALHRRLEGWSIREQEHVNIFAGIGYCGCCGGTIGRGSKSQPRVYERLICRTKHATGKCKDAPSHGMAKTIRALRTVFAGQFTIVPPTNSWLDKQLAAAKLDIERSQTGVTNLYDAFGAAPSPSARSAIERAESRLTECKSAAAEIDRRLVLERGEVSEPDAMRTVIELVETAAAGDRTARATIAQLLKSVALAGVAEIWLPKPASRRFNSSSELS